MTESRNPYTGKYQRIEREMRAERLQKQQAEHAVTIAQAAAEARAIMRRP